LNIESELTATSALAERAKGLVPLLDENADQSDEDGLLSDAVVEALHDNSLFGMWVPEVVGGSELDPIRSLEVIANLSYGDPSVGRHGVVARERDRHRLPRGRGG
jgi:alkylation response protein AidB-like acyl-CoA dehydrogenase